jgi:hypothetical protein
VPSDDDDDDDDVISDLSHMYLLLVPFAFMHCLSLFNYTCCVLCRYFT